MLRQRIGVTDVGKFFTLNASEIAVWQRREVALRQESEFQLAGPFLRQVPTMPRTGVSDFEDPQMNFRDSKKL